MEYLKAIKRDKKTHCSRCKKEKPLKKVKRGLLTINICETCLPLLKKKEAVEKRKVARKKRAEIITEKKLDAIFSRWIRTCYPSICHSTLQKGSFSDFHCSHFIGRNNRCVRFDTRNCYPCFAAENMYNQLHVIELAKRLKEYYDIEYSDFANAAKQSTCKLSGHDRREMYDIFKAALETAEAINKGEITIMTLEELRNEVIRKTKRIL
jgi:hypothetical protein